jgi:hypothetical protein
LLAVVEVGAGAAAGRAEEAVVECRPRQAVRPQWAAAWAPEQHGRRLAPQAAPLGLVQER